MVAASPTREDFTCAPSETPQLLRLADLRAAWVADADAAHQARVAGRPRGPITGLALLDRELGGYLAPGLHVVHGGPGVGKTALMLQIATSCDCPCLYASCEMGPLELLRRLTARLTSTYLGRLKSGELAPADSLAKLDVALEKAPDLVLVDATRAYASPAWLQAAAQAVRGDAAHLLIILDSLHSWAESVPVDTDEYTTLNSALATLQQLANALDCPIVAVTERNRASMKAGGLNAGAGTRKLEYRGESVVGLDVDEKGQIGPPGCVNMVAVIEKNRNGSPGARIPLSFRGALQQFETA
jgi:replicative DNA helicase